VSPTIIVAKQSASAGRYQTTEKSDPGEIGVVTLHIPSSTRKVEHCVFTAECPRAWSFPSTPRLVWRCCCQLGKRADPNDDFSIDLGGSNILPESYA